MLWKRLREYREHEMKRTVWFLSLLVISIIFAGCPGVGSEPETYTVTYDGTAATGGEVPLDTQSYEEGQTVTVFGNTGNLVKSGDSFSGWNTDFYRLGTNYTQGQTFMIGAANVVLYAQWRNGF